MTCLLCDPVKKTRWYFEGPDFSIFDCETCLTPMLVTVEHTMNPSSELVERMKSKAKELFGDVKFREKQRKILNHYHIHVI